MIVEGSDALISFVIQMLHVFSSIKVLEKIIIR